MQILIFYILKHTKISYDGLLPLNTSQEEAETQQTKEEALK